MLPQAQKRAASVRAATPTSKPSPVPSTEPATPQLQLSTLVCPVSKVVVELPAEAVAVVSEGVAAELGSVAVGSEPGSAVVVAMAGSTSAALKPAQHSTWVSQFVRNRLGQYCATQQKAPACPVTGSGAALSVQQVQAMRAVGLSEGGSRATSLHGLAAFYRGVSPGTHLSLGGSLLSPCRADVHGRPKRGQSRPAGATLSPEDMLQRKRERSRQQCREKTEARRRARQAAGLPPIERALRSPNKAPGIKAKEPKGGVTRHASLLGSLSSVLVATRAAFAARHPDFGAWQEGGTCLYPLVKAR